MWKNSEPKPAVPAQRQQAAPQNRVPIEHKIATIGPSISIQGDISGEGNLVIEGRVHGGIELRQHEVTIGRSGQVEADVKAKRICVEGKVKGNLFGEEVIVRESGQVDGDATAPQVTLENGCQFRGRINMDAKGGKSAGPKSKGTSTGQSPR